MKWHWIWLGVAFELVAISAFAYTVSPKWIWLDHELGEPIYTRAECSVRTTVQYPPGSDKDAIEDMGGEVDEFFMDAIRFRMYPLADFRFGKEDAFNHFIMFTGKCNLKFEMVQNIVDSFHHFHPDGPNLRVTRDPVVPSPDTVASHGPSWTDGDKPFIRPAE